MLYIYFIFLTVLFCIVIYKSSFFLTSGIRTKVLVSLFVIRIIVAVAGHLTNIYLYPDADYIRYQHFAEEETDLLFSNPLLYVTNLFTDGYGNRYSGFFSTENSYWNNLGSNVIIKLLSLFNLISFKNFLINNLLFNMLFFTGLTALYRACKAFFPDAGNTLIAGIFLLPSAMFFSAFPHKDGMTLFLLSFLIYQIHHWLEHRKAIRIGYILVFLGLLFITRAFVFLAICPALIAWGISVLADKKPLPVFMIVYAVCITLFFGSSYLHPGLNLPAIVASRQAAFLEIAPMSQTILPIKPLEPTLWGYLQSAPQALQHTLLRPFPLEDKKLIYIPFSIEIILYLAIFISFIFYRKPAMKNTSFLYFCLFFSLSMFLLIGYTIPILGAIVRYRSIYFIFLLLPLFVQTEWKKVPIVKHIRFGNM